MSNFKQSKYNQLPSLIGPWKKQKQTNFTVYFDVDSALSFIERVPVHGPSPVREYFCYLWSAGRHLEGGPIGAGQKLHLGGGQYSPCQVQPHWGQWLWWDYSCVICFNYVMLINLVGKIISWVCQKVYIFFIILKFIITLYLC